MVSGFKNYEKSYLLFIDVAIMIFLFMLLYQTVINNKLIIGLEISFFLILILVYINMLFKNNSTFFIDIRLSFILGYFFYNLYTPIVYCFRKSEILEYGSSNIGWIFNSNDVQKSLFISILFLGGLLLALTLVKNRKTCVSSDDKKYLIISKNSKVDFYLWLIIFIISFLWYAYPYIKIGSQIINYDRWYRYAFLFNQLKEQLGIISKVFNFLFNNYLILISLFMMFKNTVNNISKLQRFIFIGVLALYSVFILFIDLRRRELLIVILMCISYYFSKVMYNLDKKILKKKIKKNYIFISNFAYFFYDISTV